MNRPAALLLALLLPLSPAPAAPDTAWNTFSADGAWNAFSDPRALADQGRVYAGWVTAYGAIQVGALDPRLRTTQVHTLAEKFDQNDHASPALLLLPDGRLMAFYTRHDQGDLQMRITSRPADVTAWEPARPLGFLPAQHTGRGLAYAHPVLLRGEQNTIFIFYRGTNGLPTFATSRDLGGSWSSPRPLFQPPQGNGPLRPYMKVWSDGATRISFLFTDGHPKDHPSNRVYFVRYEKGTFWKADGSRIASLEDLPLQPAACDLVYDGSAGRAWLGSLAETADGKPVAAYIRYPSPTNHLYRYVRWDAGKWIDHALCAAGPSFVQAAGDKEVAEPYFAGGLALAAADPASVYLARPIKGRFEIERWTTPDGGAHWTTTAITENSTSDNVRPCSVTTSSGGTPSVLWMNLRRYTDYRNYDALILMNDPPAPARAISTQFAPGAIRADLESVAHWQLAHPGRYKTTDWTQGALYAGMMALAGISPDTRFREAMRSIGEQNAWQPGPRLYHADDHVVAQTYAKLYEIYRDARMLAPTRERFDHLLANRATNSLSFVGPHDQITRRWSWCDALFMGPPAWLRLYRITSDRRYRDFAVSEWWATSDYLYDKEEHLYYRDSRYFPQREANGRKVFWSRGNGWVLGGLARVLQVLPADDPDRARFVDQFKAMAATVVKVQQADGLWRSSLLDPDSYPLQETSGSGFFTFALAWGINQGLLDRATYEPAVRKGWAGLLSCVNPDGRLTHVQPIGADPKKFDPHHTDVYGVGAFLLAGTEVYRLAIQDATRHADLTVRNPVDARRGPETIELPWRDVVQHLGGNPGEGVAVLDAATSRILDRQVLDENGDGIPDQLLFQSEFLPGETRTFRLLVGLSPEDQPAPALSTHGRFVPERKDDYAWENDRIAFRIYGPALQKTPGEVSGSGVDVWLKSTRRLVVDEWCAGGDYHTDHGEGVDAYKVGTTRGCGGLAIRVGGELGISANFASWRRLATGPIRTLAEFEYAPWTAGDRQVREVKRVALDRGSNLNRIESSLMAEPAGDLAVAVGLANRPGNGAVQVVEKEGWLTYTEPEAPPHGRTHTAVVFPGGLTMASEPTHWLATRVIKPGEPLVYYAGAGWDRYDFPTPEAWQAYVQLFAWNVAHPLEVQWKPAAP